MREVCHLIKTVTDAYFFQKINIKIRLILLLLEILVLFQNTSKIELRKKQIERNRKIIFKIIIKIK